MHQLHGEHKDKVAADRASEDEAVGIDVCEEAFEGKAKENIKIRQ